MEQHEVGKTATGNRGIGIARLFVPMKALDCEGKRGYEGDGQRVGIAEYLWELVLFLVVHVQSFHTAMATTKFVARFLKPHHHEMNLAQPYETSVWITNIRGIRARPGRSSRRSFEESL